MTPGLSMRGSARELVSRAVVVPLVHGARLASHASSAGERAYRDGLAFRSMAASWDAERRSTWVLERLRAVVRGAANASQFWRERLASNGFDPRADFSFDDFARLPILTRDDVADHSTEIRITTDHPALVRRDATGGSSGKPLVYYSGPQERGWRQSGIEHYMRRIGVPEGSRRAFLWGHHLDPVARDSLRDRARDAVEHQRWYDCLRLDDARAVAYHRSLQAWRPRCIIAYAGALRVLARAAGTGARYPLTFVTGAEKLTAPDRAFVQSVFPWAGIHERYGSREVGMMAFQPAPGISLDFEVDWANVLVEPASGDTPAEILVTKLNADAFPMLRYRIDDVARFPEGARPGHPCWALHEITGRTLDVLHAPGGRAFHPIGIPHLLKDFPVREYQLYQRADYTVTLFVVPDLAFTDDTATTIQHVLEGNLPGVPVSVVRREALERTAAGKLRAVISEVQPPANGSAS